jgi:hypothetical protein
MRSEAILLVLLPAVTLAQSSPWAGAEVCGRCHAAQYRLQSSSEHARALYPAASHPLAARFPTKAPLRRGDFDLRLMLDSRGLLLRIASSQGALVLPVEWAFGAGDQAVTFVSRTAPEQYREFYYSYYTRTGTMDVTPGQEAIRAYNLDEAAGFVHRGLDGLQCFECHSTGPVDISGGVFRPHEPGIRCEACHGPGLEHASSGGKAPIRNPRRLSGTALNDACGKCHRLAPPEGSTFEWNNPWNVRFQPAYLSRSACFRRSQDRLSCLTCHAAHEPLRRNDPAYYNRICAGCHQAPHRQTAMQECVACHMPAVSPRAPLVFVNHWIGIYRNSSTSPVARP